MKLWLLAPRGDLSDDNNPWKPWYDKVFGFLVCAETAEEARQVANENAGDETVAWDNVAKKYTRDDLTPWLNSRFSTCVELLPEGEPRVILRDFRSA